MVEFNKKFAIKIPKNISCFCDEKKEIIIFQSNKKKIFIKINLRIVIEKKINQLLITDIPLKSISNKEKKVLKASQGLVVAQIKQALFELTETFYQKLKFVGIGYRAIGVQKLNFNYFFLKLGLSHLLFLNAADKICNVTCLKYTKLYISGVSYSHICQVAAYIRSYKAPEPYKGKGILYVNEKIQLKEGKKNLRTQ